MHLAAANKDSEILPLVCKAYKMAQLFPKVMLMRNKSDDYTPIHAAIASSCVQNTLFLYKECEELCPQALEPYENGERHTCITP